MRLSFLKNIWIWAGVFLLVLFWWDETWLMPGPLSQKHAFIQDKCHFCHPGWGKTPDQGCLSCKTKMSFKPDKGIHKYAPIKRCATCHVEHRGKAYPLAYDWVNTNDFNHDYTGFNLRKFHKKLLCLSCHISKGPYDRLKNTQAKPIKNIQGDICEKCHLDFTPVLFDHNKTGQNLDALHQGLACENCHSGWAKGLKPACAKCHKNQNYTPKDWVNFNYGEFLQK